MTPEMKGVCLIVYLWFTQRHRECLLSVAQLASQFYCKKTSQLLVMFLES